MKMQHMHYYLDQEKNAFIKPKLVFSGFLQVGKGWSSTNHSHDFCEIMYIVSGSGISIVDGIKHTIKTNDIVIYDPKVLHEEISESTNFHIVFFAVDNLKIPSLPEGCLLSQNANHVIPAENHDAILKTLFETLLREINNKETGYKAIATYLASSIVFYILRLQKMSTENSEVLELLKKTKDYIGEKYMNEINLDELADFAHLSKFYYLHLFKEIFSVSPIRYHAMVRLEKAREFLLTTNLSIAEISEKVGYEDYTTFLRAFKNKEKISPKEYRIANKNKSI